MMKISVYLMSLFCALATFAFAQPTHINDDSTGVAVSDTAVAPSAAEGLASSLLWEISGNGLEQPSYLFGTIHIIGKDDYFWTDVMEEKFQTTKTLVLEIDMKNPTLMAFSMLKDMRMKDGMTLRKLLTEEEYARVEAHFTQKMGMSLGMFNNVKPIFTSMMLAENGTTSGGTVSYEMQLIDKAKAKKMKTGGLETASYQISMFDSIPYEDQAKMLLDAVEGKGDSGEEMFDEMVSRYKAQDLEGLYKLIAGSEDLGEFEDMLLITRNKNWIPKIAEYAAKQPTFIAVGAGHLPGKQGVIRLLQAAGYTLKPIH
jgi:uncharacterized protein